MTEGEAIDYIEKLESMLKSLMTVLQKDDSYFRDDSRYVGSFFEAIDYMFKDDDFYTIRDWWETQKAKEELVLREKEEQKRKRIVEIKSKLTSEELNLLGL